MSYVTDSLVKDEVLVYASRPHWIVFVPSILILLSALLIAIYLPQYIHFSQPIWHGYYLHELLAGVVAIAGLVSIIRAYIFYSTSEYGISNKRIMMKIGLMRLASLEVFIQRVESVTVNQTFMGQLLNYGTVVVIGTGGTSDFYTNVPKPAVFRGAILEQMNRLSNNGN